LRRDFTINSLYYNINTNTVEDYTGMGLEDLENGIVRTPCDPLKTLLEDPLRVLRSIRFTETFGFAMEPSLAQALTHAAVKEELAHKVSRSRIGIEINKMLGLGTTKTYRALKRILEADMHDTVFVMPTTLASAMQRPAPCGALSCWPEYRKGLAALFLDQMHRLLVQQETAIPPREEGHAAEEWFTAQTPHALTSEAAGNGLTLLTTLLTPIFLESQQTGTSPQVSLHALRHRIDKFFKINLQLSSNHGKASFGLLAGALSLVDLVHSTEPWREAGGADYVEHVLHHRVAYGNWLRSLDLSFGNGVWPAAIRLASLITQFHLRVFHFDATGLIQGMRRSGIAASVLPMSCLLSGDDIIHILGMKPGRAVGDIKARLLSWQIENFKTQKTKEDAVAYISKLPVQQGA
jgi:hypothetical protein